MGANETRLNRFHALFKRFSVGSKLEGVIELVNELKTKVDALATLTAELKTKQDAQSTLTAELKTVVNGHIADGEHVLAASVNAAATTVAGSAPAAVVAATVTATAKPAVDQLDT